MNFLLNPIAFEIFGMQVRWYGVILTIGIICALGLFAFLCHKKKMGAELSLDVFLAGVPLAIIGARLLYVIPREQYFPVENLDDFMELIGIWNGGATILGGIMFGAAGIAIAAVANKKSVFRVLDMVVPAVLLGQVIGRWGNFVNVELYGLEVSQDWMKFFPFAIQKNGVWHYASFFYESMLNLCALAVVLILIFKLKDRIKPGVLTVAYVTWYTLIRALLEFIKDKSSAATFPGSDIKIAQTLCFIAAFFGVITLILLLTGKIKLETERMRQRHFNNLKWPTYTDNSNLNAADTAVENIVNVTDEKHTSKRVNADLE